MNRSIFALPRILQISLIALAGGTCGFYLKAIREPEVTVISAQQIPALDYFVTERSFSEVEEAKNLLRASANRCLAEFVDGLRLLKLAPGASAAQLAKRDLWFARADAELQRQLQDYKGTEEELLLVEQSLWLSCLERKYDRWIQTYLEVVYQHPTHPMVARFAEQALRTAPSAGRQQDLLQALHHLIDIPFDFEGKARIRTLLRQDSLVARNSAEPSAPHAM